MSTSFRKIDVTFAITLGILTVLIFPQVQPASAISAYDSGYNHGCSDAHSGGHPYLDSPGKGPSFHTGTFMQGYDTGYSACFTGSPENSGGSPQQTCSDGSQPDSNGNCPTQQPTQQQGKTIEDYCDQYHDLLALSHPCNTYVIGNHILGPGSFFIVCNLIKLGVSAHTLGLLALVPCG